MLGHTIDCRVAVRRRQRLACVAFVLSLLVWGCDDPPEDDVRDTRGTADQSDVSEVDLGGVDQGIPDADPDSTSNACAALNRVAHPAGGCGACIANYESPSPGSASLCCPSGQVSSEDGSACLASCDVSCGPNGTCGPTDGGGVGCQCDPGWRGVVCEAVDDCAGVVCENGGTCLDIGDEALCRCPVGVSGDRCETVCEPNPEPIVSCASTATIPAEACQRVIDGDLDTGVTFDCASEGNGYCDYSEACDPGCFDFMRLIAVYDEPRTISQVRYYSDWWAKRPSAWSVHVADTWEDLQARRDREVAIGVGNEAPWNCENGASCDVDVPDACCPDGRDQPQRVEETSTIARWDIYDFPPDTGEVWILQLEGSYDPSLMYFQEMAFYSPTCSLDRSCPAGMTLVGDDCVDTDGCAGDPCPSGQVCLDRLPPDTGYDCGTRDDPTPQPCDEGPCYPGVSCTNRPGETPDFACGQCPVGTSGDGVSCTVDEGEPPELVSTVPADGSTTRLSSTGFNPGEPNRLTLSFDRAVVSAAATATADHVDSDFEEALEVRTPTSMDRSILELWPTSTAFPSYPSGEYRITVENIRASGGGTLDEYSWSFAVEGCGDGVCSAAESSCTCVADCGPCAGCCRFEGGDRAPSSVCRPGTQDDECGTGGASCGVCESGCAPGGAGCL